MNQVHVRSALPVDVDDVPDGDCPRCIGGEGAVLGQLGRVLHLRCRQCGWTFSVDAPEGA